eukprot:795520-Karenia_brevis.AAC.1
MNSEIFRVLGPKELNKTKRNQELVHSPNINIIKTLMKLVLPTNDRSPWALTDRALAKRLRLFNGPLDRTPLNPKTANPKVVKGKAKAKSQPQNKMQEVAPVDPSGISILPGSSLAQDINRIIEKTAKRFRDEHRSAEIIDCAYEAACLLVCLGHTVVNVDKFGSDDSKDTYESYESWPQLRERLSASIMASHFQP